MNQVGYSSGSSFPASWREYLNLQDEKIEKLYKELREEVRKSTILEEEKKVLQENLVSNFNHF